MTPKTPLESLLVHLDMLKSKADTVDIESIIHTIENVYLPQEDDQRTADGNAGYRKALADAPKYCSQCGSPIKQ